MSKQRFMLLFEQAIKSEATKKAYKYHLSKFKDWAKIKNSDGLLQAPQKDIQILLEDYVMYLKNTVSPNSIPIYFAPLELFYVMNDVNLNFKKIRKLFPEKVKKGNERGYTHDEIRIILNSSKTRRHKALILLLASSGCRIGAIPDIKLKHLQKIKESYSVKIYDGEKEEDHVFTTPEATKAIDSYLDERKQDGEYVENGETNRCTTKIATPPADYLWEPGPEDGNYYSEKEEIPLHQYQDANERKSYRDALDSGSIVLLAESPKLSDKELDNVMDELVNSELDRFVLPIASIAIDYQRDTLVLWTPDLTIGNKVQAVIGDISFVLLYEEAPPRWGTGDPGENGIELEPYPDPNNHDRPCPPGLILDWDICINECRIGQIESNGICREINSNSIESFPLYFVIALASIFVIIIAVIVITFVSRRKRT